MNENLGKKMMFSISNGVAMFDMLASFYKNKHKAIIRELVTNAIDAHKESGYDGAIKVHIPTRAEPWITIRDFGLGMSYEKVNEVYIVLGESSKGSDSEQTGKYGLGSKTPFSLYNNYTVISYYDGKKSTYEISRNPGEIPECLFAAEEDSDETGIEIKINVKEEDIAAFHRAIYEVCLATDVFPDFTNSENFATILEPSTDTAWTEDDYYEARAIIQGDEQFLLNVNNPIITKIEGYTNHIAFVRINNILYPTNLDDFDYSNKEKELIERVFNSVSTTYNNAHVIIMQITDTKDNANLITPQRETLALNDYTKGLLLDKLEDILNTNVIRIKTLLNNDSLTEINDINLCNSLLINDFLKEADFTAWRHNVEGVYNVAYERFGYTAWLNDIFDWKTSFKESLIELFNHVTRALAKNTRSDDLLNSETIVCKNVGADISKVLKSPGVFSRASTTSNAIHSSIESAAGFPHASKRYSYYGGVETYRPKRRVIYIDKEYDGFLKDIGLSAHIVDWNTDYLAVNSSGKGTIDRSIKTIYNVNEKGAEKISGNELYNYQKTETVVCCRGASVSVAVLNGNGAAEAYDIKKFFKEARDFLSSIEELEIADQIKSKTKNILIVSSTEYNKMISKGFVPLQSMVNAVRKILLNNGIYRNIIEECKIAGGNMDFFTDSENAMNLLSKSKDSEHCIKLTWQLAERLCKYRSLLTDDAANLAAKVKSGFNSLARNDEYTSKIKNNLRYAENNISYVEKLFGNFLGEDCYNKINGTFLGVKKCIEDYLFEKAKIKFSTVVKASEDLRDAVINSKENMKSVIMISGMSNAALDGYLSYLTNN